MKKITEIVETRSRTVYRQDGEGNRYRDSEEYQAYRAVKSISPGPRFGQFIVDLIAFEIVVTIINYFFELILHFTNFNFAIHWAISLVLALSTIIIYPAFYAFLEYKWQKTPGKFLMKTTVIDQYGNRPELRTIILRSLIRLVPFEPFSCFDNYSRGWHDRWSDTWVVTDEELQEIRRLQAE